MKPTHVLVVGASGSIGRHAVEKARAAGYRVRALVRDPSRIHFGCGVEVVQGDLTSVESMRQALDGIDGIVFTHGSNGGPTLTETVDYGAVRNALEALDGRPARIALMTSIGVTNMDNDYNRSNGGPTLTETVDYGAVRNALEALDGRPARIALMTSIGVTNMDNDYNRSTEAHDWKRRSERLVRASGNEYTIVRPGWFDMEGADEHQLKFEQGDRRDPMGPQDGSVARRQIAQTLVDALGCEEADHKTLELIDVAGTAQTDAELASMFAALQPDTGLDGVLDRDNFPECTQPKRVREQIARIETMRAEQ